MLDIYHVIPAFDLIEHEEDNEGSCVCGPTPVKVESEEANSLIYLHNSLDGREVNNVQVRFKP